MKLYGKTLVALVADGVYQQEIDLLRERFEAEGAILFITSPQDHITIETLNEGKRGGDLLVDMPFEMLPSMDIQGLVLPGGNLSVKTLLQSAQTKELIGDCYEQGVPIIASDETISLLYEAGAVRPTVLVRDQLPLDRFVERAVALLAEPPLRLH